TDEGLPLRPCDRRKRAVLHRLCPLGKALDHGVDVEFGHTSRVPVRRPDFSPVERQWNGGVPPKAGRGRGPKGRKRSALVPLSRRRRGKVPAAVALSPRAGGEGGRSLPPWLCPPEPEAKGEGPCRRSEAEAGGRGQSFPPTKTLTRRHDAWPAMVSVTISRLPRTSLFQNRITR